MGCANEWQVLRIVTAPLLGEQRYMDEVYMSGTISTEGLGRPNAI